MWEEGTLQGYLQVKEGRKGNRQNQGCKKYAQISNSIQAEGMSNIRNIDTIAVFNTLQLISTERNARHKVSPSVDSACKQPQQVGGQQAYQAAIDVHAT